MNKSEKLILIKNAAANVVRGGAAAIVALCLPPFLVRMMSPDSYGAWALVLQLSACVGYLDFGIQTAVGRFVAHANENRNSEHRDRIVNTSLAALASAAAIAIAVSVVIAIFLPDIFHHMPLFLINDTRVALVMVATSLAIGLPASVFNGMFIGHQRYEIPAAIIGGSRFVSALLLVLVVKLGGNLTQMALWMSVVNLASYALQFLMYRRMLPQIQFSTRLVSRETAKELLDYCLSLTIWSFAMLLITGLDVALVGYFQFEAVAYYSVAATLVTLLAGLQNALFGVMIPATAVLHARGNSRELGNMMVTATRYGTFLLLLTGVPLILAARSILTLWVGTGYAAHGTQILQVLVTANIIRLSAVPYVVTLIGMGQQKLVISTPIMEGLSNVLVSVIAGHMFGALGVAWGTLVGSIVGVAGNLVYNMRRTTDLDFRISSYLQDGLFRPIVCAFPLVLFGMWLYWLGPIAPVTIALTFIGMLFLTVFFVWRWGLVGSEREKLLGGLLATQL